MQTIYLTGLQFWGFVVIFTLCFVLWRAEKRDKEELKKPDRWEAHCSICDWHTINVDAFDAWSSFSDHYRDAHGKQATR